ncbi:MULTISPECIES: MarR family transcriptional regulator [Cryobacterium]|uniref:MarR family transcriptional regulator n=1 Tax=Cryobacterium breve TaxID=1259258 RepID=A0ABY2JAX8_9MICO|nr:MULTISPECIES: MarR family transcriptional regulator [Cryobacterium]TFC94522.1 MarR family transcriptional regulator [Cryobacterium sp. TmT3-12]TFD01991.1 MarR family transcriptional regulator [Cryobacterium breve]
MNDALRAYGEGYDQLGRTFAASAGLHSTDATALIEILRAEEQGEPISPARLSDRIGLTSGATSTLLNRLEDAGHIRRSRENTDRRVVTLHSTPGIHATADAFFDPLDQQLAAVMDKYTPEAIQQLATLLEELHETMSNHGSSPE